MIKNILLILSNHSMPSCFCIKKVKKTNPVTIDTLFNYVCDITYHMLMADVYGRCDTFVEHGGWNFKYRTDFMENHNMGLIIDVKYPLNNLTTQGEDKNECVVCNENTNDSIICCKQPVCKKCLKDIQKHQPDNFCCPMCRKNLDTYTKTFTLTKEDVRKQCSDTY